jgi:Mycothiol maleylpyruvate isomerase N-terminal domain
MDYAVGHRDGQQRVVALVRTLDASRLDTIVPLNPAWRVRDVVAHMAGVGEDSLARRFPDFSDPKGQPQQARDRDD